MTIQRFEDCIAWQKAQDLAADVSEQLKETMIRKCEEVIKIIWGLIRSLRAQQAKGLK